MAEDLVLQSVSRLYGDTTVVHDVSLRVRAGEFMTFLGPSGSGKTTTLNMVAGFIEPTSGDVRIGDRSLIQTPPHRRGIGFVFQNYALFPHMTALQNVMFPLEQRRVAKKERIERARDALDLVHLADLASRYPAELSGGQQQRVALARAIVFEPSLLLMDEPLGALDRKLREALQIEIKELHRRLGMTFIYVTHDQDEALVLSDRIAIFNEGRIEQVDTPEVLYDRPATIFVAGFLGEANVVQGSLEIVGGIVRLDEQGLSIQARPQTPEGRPSALVVRPERIALRGPEDIRESDLNFVEGTVEDVHFLGVARRYLVAHESGRRFVVREAGDARDPWATGARVRLAWSSEDTIAV